MVILIIMLYLFLKVALAMLTRLALLAVLVALSPVAMVFYASDTTSHWTKKWVSLFLGANFQQVVVLIVIYIGGHLIGGYIAEGVESLESFIVGVLLGIMTLAIADKVPKLVNPAGEGLFSSFGDMFTMAAAAAIVNTTAGVGSGRWCGRRHAGRCGRRRCGNGWRRCGFLGAPLRAVAQVAARPESPVRALLAVPRSPVEWVPRQPLRVVMPVWPVVSGSLAAACSPGWVSAFPVSQGTTCPAARGRGSGGPVSTPGCGMLCRATFSTGTARRRTIPRRSSTRSEVWTTT